MSVSVCGILCEVTTVCRRKDDTIHGMRLDSMGLEDGEKGCLLTGICGGLACCG